MKNRYNELDMLNHQNANKNEHLISRYFEIFEYFLIISKTEEPRIQSGLYKWGNQLGLSTIELNDHLYKEREEKVTQKQYNRQEAIQVLFDFVMLIYLDGIIEDFELLILDRYAKNLGLEGSIINDILKAIVTAKDDGATPESVQKDLISIIN